MSNHVQKQNGSPLNSKTEFPNLKELPHILKNLDINQKIYPDILSVIGKSPMVKLNKIPAQEGLECDVYAKCEYLNPGGSVKDRIAYRMVLDAEERGVLTPGKSVIIEPTSGNTGIGLALASAIKGYRCIIVLPEKMSDEKVNTLVALGAEIVRTPTEAPSESPDSNIGVAARLSKEIPHAVVLNQYENPCNPLAHYDGTAEEILWALDEDVDMVVIGAGTSGTVSGVGHKIKERCPKCTVVAIDPYGSILAQPDELNVTDVQMYEVEGVGYDFLPASLDRKIIDKWLKTDDKESLQMSRRLIKEEGLLCGGSSGAVVSGAMRAARALRRGQRCVVLLPDSVRNYMTKFICDQWMEARDFKPLPTNEHVSWWKEPLNASLAQKVGSVPLSATPAAALAALGPARSPVLAVVDERGSTVGVFTADNVRRRLANIGASLEEPLEKFVVKKAYRVDLATKPTLGIVSRLLDITPFVLVVNTDSATQVTVPIGIITSEDLLSHMASKQVNGK